MDCRTQAEQKREPFPSKLQGTWPGDIENSSSEVAGQGRSSPTQMRKARLREEIDLSKEPQEVRGGGAGFCLAS